MSHLKDTAKWKMAALTLSTILLTNMMVIPVQAGTRVVAYYPSWLKATYPCTLVDYSQMTHIAQAFVWPNTNGTLDVTSDWSYYPELVREAHAHGVKIIVSVGGGGRGTRNFAVMANNPVARSNFVQQLTAFCVSNNYDGADIDWEAPANATDTTNFTALVQELRTAFRAAHADWTLSAAVKSRPWAGKWLDIDGIKDALDWIGVMTYDYHGPWSKHSGYNAPLYGDIADPDKLTQCIDASVQYYLSRNVPREKLLLGIPFYGYQFNSTALYATNTAGMELTYGDVLQRISNHWTRAWDRTSLVPYLLNPERTQVATYDDPLSVQYKCEYAVNRGLGGAIIWALGEDFVSGKTPLLDVIGTHLLKASNTVVMLDTFENSTGHFNTAPSASVSTVGISTSSTATLTNGVSHTGTNSLVLALTDDKNSHSNWTVRLLSNGGDPARQSAVGTNGYVGFWLRTTAANMSVAIAVRDAKGIKRSVTRSVLGDGQWNLFEWNLAEPSQWNSWSNNTGVVNGRTTTVDSIWLFAPDDSPDATVYLDDVYEISPVSGEHGNNGRPH